MHRAEPVDKSDSLFHRAANYALYAIVASFVLKFAYAQVWLRLSPGAARLLGFVPEIVMISAIPAGLIALGGIPRYGRAKLLWKGIVGVFFPILLFVFVVCFSAYLRARMAEEARKIEQKN